MLNTTESPIPRRAFLGSLLLAASTGCGGGGVTKSADGGQGQPKQKEVAASTEVAAGVPGLEDSGMRPKIISENRPLITQARWMLLCCGPTDSGWMATLYECPREVGVTRRSSRSRIQSTIASTTSPRSRSTVANRGPHLSRPHCEATVARYMNCQPRAGLMLRSRLLRCRRTDARKFEAEVADHAHLDTPREINEVAY